MKILRLAGGVSIYGASAWIAPMIADLFNISQIVGFVTVGGLMAFVGGMVFYSGVRSE